MSSAPTLLDSLMGSGSTTLREEEKNVAFSSSERNGWADVVARLALELPPQFVVGIKL